MAEAFRNLTGQTVPWRRAVRVSKQICGQPSSSCAEPNRAPTHCDLELSVPPRRRVGVELSFWPLQMGGWLVYTVAIATSNLPLRHERELVAFRTSFVISAFLASFVMYLLCRTMRLRKVSVLRSIAVCMFTCAVLGLGGSALAVWSEISFGGSTYPFHWSTAFPE